MFQEERRIIRRLFLIILLTSCKKIDNVDLDVETLFTSMVSQPFQGQGVIIQQDDVNFIRFGIYTTGCQAYIFGATIDNGVLFAFLDEPVENGPALY